MEPLSKPARHESSSSGQEATHVGDGLGAGGKVGADMVRRRGDCMDVSHSRTCKEKWKQLDASCLYMHVWKSSELEHGNVVPAPHSHLHKHVYQIELG